MNIRRINLDGAINTRDLGGLINTKGKSIAPKRLIRSGELSACSQNDKLTLLNTYNLKKVIDLRTDIEIEEAPNPKLDGVEYYKFPVFDAEVMGITRDGNSLNDMIKTIMTEGAESAKEYMANIYKEILGTNMAKTAYRNLIMEIAENKEGAVLWNCSAGKDRTGMGAILLLNILEFDKESIYEDYYSTNIFVENNIADFANTVTSLTGIKDTRKAAEYMLGVNRDYFEAVYKYVNSEYGSIEEYIKYGLNIHNDTVIEIRKKYLI